MPIRGASVSQKAALVGMTCSIHGVPGSMNEVASATPVSQESSRVDGARHEWPGSVVRTGESCLDRRLRILLAVPVGHLLEEADSRDAAAPVTMRSRKP